MHLYGKQQPEMAQAGDLAVFRETLIERGRRRVQSFDWDDSARRHLALFEEVVADRPTR